VQSVSRREVAGLKITAPHRGGVLADGADLALHHPHPCGYRGLVQGFGQDRSAHTEARSGPEVRLDAVGVVQIGDSPKRLAVQWDTDGLQLLDGVRHQPFAARLVDRSLPAVDHDGLQTGARGMDGGGQAGGSAAGDDEVDHDSLASAVFSTWMRLLSRAALSTVKLSAVIQAVCTRGSAMPSATTAT